MGSHVQIALLPVDQLVPDPEQHRKHFDQQKLAELADSIRRHGVIEPLLVRPLPDGRHMIIAGERRYRASRIAGRTDVPVVIREMDDAQAFEVGVIENVQRANVNPIEEANAYRKMMDDNGWSTSEVADAVGVPWQTVASRLHLLDLHPSIQQLVITGHLRNGEALEIARASRHSEHPHEVQFAILRQVNAGTPLADVVKMITMIKDKQLQGALFELQAIPEEARAVRRSFDERIEKLERLCAHTWDEREQTLLLRAFDGDLELTIDRLRLIGEHIERMARILDTERVRRKARKELAEVA